MKGSATDVAAMALVPIPLGWLAGCILLWVVRIQIAGIHVVMPWATLAWSTKAFVIFCALTSVGAVLLGLTAISNLYVDAEVPVMLARRALTKVGDFVTVEGTWTRSGRGQGSSIGYPLQTSRIECNKEERQCTEARAYVAGRTLFSDLVTYDVESWTAGAIVFRLDTPCATEVFVIDLNTEAVSGAGHLTNKDKPSCRIHPGDEESWKYQLSDGFPVYWEQRRNARPLPLRLIQTLFDN